MEATSGSDDDSSSQLTSPDCEDAAHVDAMIDEAMGTGLNMTVGKALLRALLLTVFIAVIPLLCQCAWLGYLRRHRCKHPPLCDDVLVGWNFPMNIAGGAIFITACITICSERWFREEASMSSGKEAKSKKDCSRWDGITNRGNAVAIGHVTRSVWRELYSDGNRGGRHAVPKRKECCLATLLALTLTLVLLVVCWLPVQMLNVAFLVKWRDCINFGEIAEAAGGTPQEWFNFSVACALEDAERNASLTFRVIDDRRWTRYVSKWDPELVEYNLYVPFYFVSIRLRQISACELLGSAGCALYVIMRVCIYRERHALQLVLINAIREHTVAEKKHQFLNEVVVTLPWKDHKEARLPMFDVFQRMGRLKEMLLPQPTPDRSDYLRAFCLWLMHALGPGIARCYLLADSQLAFIPQEHNISCAMVMSSVLFGLVVAEFWAVVCKALPLYARATTRLELLRATWHEPTAAVLHKFCEDNNSEAGQQLFFLQMITPLNVEIWRQCLRRIRIEAAHDKAYTEEMLVLAMLGSGWCFVFTLFAIFNAQSVSLLACMLIIVDAVIFGYPIAKCLVKCVEIGNAYTQDVCCLIGLRENLLRDADPEKNAVPKPLRRASAIHRLQSTMDETKVERQRVATMEDTIKLLHQMEYLQAVIELDAMAKDAEVLLGMKVTSAEVSKMITALVSMVGGLVLKMIQKILME